MKHDYSKALAIVGIWVAVSVVAIFAPEQVASVAGYAVAATVLAAFFI